MADFNYETDAENERLLRDFWFWVLYQIGLPAFCVIAIWPTLWFLSVPDSFEQTIAGADLPLITGLVLLGLSRELDHSTALPRMIFVPKGMLPSACFGIGLACMAIFLVWKLYIGIGLDFSKSLASPVDNTQHYGLTCATLTGAGTVYFLGALLVLTLASSIKLRLMLTDLNIRNL